jgi:ribosomal protein S18 acetylase RimI-like enzyme/uncharacterized protein YuzE
MKVNCLSYKGDNAVKYTFVNADKKIFAVSNILYSKADLEGWYDWQARLDDTMEIDENIWIMEGNKKIAGFAIQGDRIMYPFLMPPFNDRIEFWGILQKYRKENRPSLIHITGVLDEDVKIVRTYGYQLEHSRQVMCCPTEPREYVVPQGFSLHTIDNLEELIGLSQAIYDCYVDGIHNQYMGARPVEEIITDCKYLFGVYKNNLFCTKVIEDTTGKVAGICIAGLNDKMPLKFAEIADVCVLPEFRHKGIGECMINYAVSKAYEVSPVIKLCVTVGNSAESLYRNLGFTGGQTFTNLVLHESLR